MYLRILLITGTLLILTGCLSDKTADDAGDQKRESAAPAEMTAPPAGKDADIFFQATFAKDPSKCDRISESVLKKRCKKEAAE